MKVFYQDVDDIAKWWSRLEIDHHFYRPDMEKDERNIIYSFHDERQENEWASNFAMVHVFFRNEWYKGVEYAYQAAKPLVQLEANPSDASLRQIVKDIQDASTPRVAKKLGRKCPIPANWDSIKFQIMQEILDSKFNDPKMLIKLLDTKGKYLIEGNFWHDNCWGICIKPNCEKCRGVKGRNMLGNMLMGIRDDYFLRLKEYRKDAEQKAGST